MASAAAAALKCRKLISPPPEHSAPLLLLAGRARRSVRTFCWLNPSLFPLERLPLQHKGDTFEVQPPKILSMYLEMSGMPFLAVCPATLSRSNSPNFPAKGYYNFSNLFQLSWLLFPRCSLGDLWLHPCRLLMNLLLALIEHLHSPFWFNDTINAKKMEKAQRCVQEPCTPAAPSFCLITTCRFPWRKKTSPAWDLNVSPSQTAVLISPGARLQPWMVSIKIPLSLCMCCALRFCESHVWVQEQILTLCLFLAS